MYNQTMKRTIIFTATISLLIAAVIVIYATTLRPKPQLAVAEIREKYKCDRASDNVLATDIYCVNPDFYYEDAEAGTFISPLDGFDDPRYLELFPRKEVLYINKEFTINSIGAIQEGDTIKLQMTLSEALTGTCSFSLNEKGNAWQVRAKHVDIKENSICETSMPVAELSPGLPDFWRVSGTFWIEQAEQASGGILTGTAYSEEKLRYFEL